MCKRFEEITGKKNEGNKGLLMGLVKPYLDQGKRNAIIKIPVELMEVDERYQIDERTNRDLSYLTKNWNERMLMPLSGIPHYEEGKIYLVDGYGRWVASQLIDKEKYKDLEVLVVLDPPEDKEERLKLEATLYAFQNIGVAKMTPIHKHGAMLVLHDKATETMEKLKKKYGFEYKAKAGYRGASVLGSYSYTLHLCGLEDGKIADYVFEILTKAGFDRKTNGYATHIMNALKDIGKLYANDREKTKKFFIKKLRFSNPTQIKVNALSKYPMLEMRVAVSLYFEDLVVENLGLEQSREVIGNKVIPIQKAM